MAKINMPENETQNYDNPEQSNTQNLRSLMFNSVVMKTSQHEWKSGSSLNIDKAPLWFVKIHKNLMESVKFPRAFTGHLDYNLWTLQLMKTSELMALAQGVKVVDDSTQNLIVALWRRLDSMTVEEMLTTADIFYMNNVPSRYYYSALLTFVNEMFDLLDMTPVQLARLTFHIRVHGDAPQTLFHAVEEFMLKKFSEFDLNLITIICHLFFVGQNRIQSVQLLDKIARKILGNIDSVNQWYLPLLMKMFRYSNYINIGFYKKLGDTMLQLNFLKNFNSISQIMHFAFTYASVRISHQDLFTEILQYLKKFEESARIKDVSKIVWACGTLVTDKPEQIQCLQNIVQRVSVNLSLNEVWKYPDNLVDLLTGLAFLNIYPTDLYNYLFHPKMVKIILGLKADRDKFMQLHFFYHSLPIECFNYSGNELSEADIKYINDKMQFVSLEMDMKLRKCITPALNALKEALGDLFVQCRFVLPQFKSSDIVLVYDKEKRCFLKPSDTFFPVSISDLKRCEKDNVERIVIQLLSKAQSTYDNKPLGMLHCKKRQLQILGYKLISVDAEEADRYLLVDLKMTQELLLSHISNALGVDVFNSNGSACNKNDHNFVCDTT
ncbi:hypothetical protein Btru_027517 [Bulinus truncatus]|nr:hypothetical protein Btru_027517 [Bulinus truncatus]